MVRHDGWGRCDRLRVAGRGGGAAAEGQILAVKGLGGYHLAVDATSEKAAAALRERKHREDKPFAVMVADVAAARELCEVDETAERLLTSARRPIVLLPAPGREGGRGGGAGRGGRNGPRGGPGRRRRARGSRARRPGRGGG